MVRARADDAERDPPDGDADDESQSPPSRTQRSPVNPRPAAIASSSISPYMWMCSGPRSTTPELGDGIEASGGMGRSDSARAAGVRYLELEEDAQRHARGATALEELDG